MGRATLNSATLERSTPCGASVSNWVREAVSFVADALMMVQSEWLGLHAYAASLLDYQNAALFVRLEPLLSARSSVG